ncbi:MAG TPA: 5-oxoprolinase subunit PxpB [Candidatus Limnocylindrales bacterium]|nr:5-oxoprolinase subunit PxpB [Candidatus Limnocylindrales bacterium]
MSGEAGFGIVPFGDAAVLIELGRPAGIAAARLAQSVASAIDGLRLGGVGLGEPVPAATTVLVTFDPLVLTADDVEVLITPVTADAATSPGRDALPAGRLHEVPVRYGGDHGPDLDGVARETGLAPNTVIELHSTATYEVLFLGFAPGFAYLGDLPAALVLPRLSTPRPGVPAGSVAIAGAMTAVYPHASAGGWRLLGRTDVSLFDARSTPPSRLRPGDHVRFVPI